MYSIVPIQFVEPWICRYLGTTQNSLLPWLIVAKKSGCKYGAWKTDYGDAFDVFVPRRAGFKAYKYKPNNI